MSKARKKPVSRVRAAKTKASTTKPTASRRRPSAKKPTAEAGHVLLVSRPRSLSRVMCSDHRRRRSDRVGRGPDRCRRTRAKLRHVAGTNIWRTTARPGRYRLTARIGGLVAPPQTMDGRVLAHDLPGRGRLALLPDGSDTGSLPSPRSNPGDRTHAGCPRHSARQENRQGPD